MKIFKKNRTKGSKNNTIRGAVLDEISKNIAKKQIFWKKSRKISIFFEKFQK